MENLGVDIKLLIAQLVNFLLFLYIFKKFVSNSFETFLKEERKKEEIKSKIDTTIKLSEEKLKRRKGFL